MKTTKGHLTFCSFTFMDVQTAYDNWAADYDSDQNKTRDLDQKVTKKVLDQYNFKHVLELGSGTGKNTNWLLSKAESVTCLDFSESMMNKAKSKFANHPVSFEIRDITKPWNLNNRTFDLITASLVLEHLENLDNTFAQAKQHLANNGLFFISELHPFKQYLGSKARYEAGNNTIQIGAFTHHTSEYVTCAKRNGFSLITLNEWFDEDENNTVPRLISFVFSRD